MWTSALFFYSVIALLFGAYLKITSSGPRSRFSMAFGFAWPFLVLRDLILYVVYKFLNVRRKLTAKYSQQSDVERNIELARVAAQVTKWEREAAEYRHSADTNVANGQIEMARLELSLAWGLELLAHSLRFEHSLPAPEDSPARVRKSDTQVRVEFCDKDIYTSMFEELHHYRSEERDAADRVQHL